MKPFIFFVLISLILSSSSLCAQAKQAGVIDASNSYDPNGDSLTFNRTLRDTYKKVQLNTDP
jgi:hypothetical protein